MCDNSDEKIFDEKTKKLQELLGYTFKDEGLLRTALTHNSYVNEHGNGEKKDVCSYQFLEFLGDSIISFWVRQYICKKCNEENIHEQCGDKKFVSTLDEIKTRTVDNCTLCEKANKYLQFEDKYGSHHLDYFLRLGKGEEKKVKRGGGTKIFADVVESITAAICIDGGYDKVGKEGFEKAGIFVLKTLHLAEHIDDRIKIKKQSISHPIEQKSTAEPHNDPDLDRKLPDNPDLDKKLPDNPDLDRKLPDNPDSDRKLPDNPDSDRKLPDNSNLDSKSLLQQAFLSLGRGNPLYESVESKWTSKVKLDDSEFVAEGSSEKDAKQKVAMKVLKSEKLAKLLQDGGKGTAKVRSKLAKFLEDNNIDRGESK